MTLTETSQPDEISKNSGISIKISLFAGACLLGLIRWCWSCVPGMTLQYNEALTNYKGWLFLKGVYTPYLDIRTQQPPLAYFPTGLVQILFGPSVLAGRIYAATCFIAGVILVALVAKRLAGQKAMMAVLVLSLTHLFSGSFFCLGTSVSQAMLFCAACLLFLSDSRQRPRDGLGAGIFAGLSAMTLSYMGLFAIGLLIFMLVARERKVALFWLAGFGAVVILTFLPFALNLGALAQIYLPSSVFRTLETAFPVYTPFSFRVEAGLFVRFLIAFLPFIYLVFLGFKKAKQFNLPQRAAESLFFFTLMFFLISLFLAWSNSLTSRRNYTEDALAYLPLILIPAAVVLGKVFDSGIPKKRILFIVVLTLLASATIGSSHWIRVSPGAKSDLEKIKIVALELQKVSNPEDRVFAYGGAHFLLDAGRIGFAPLIDREATLVFDEDTEWVAGRNLYTVPQMYEWVQKADALVADYWGHMSNISTKATSRLETLKSYISDTFPHVKTLNPGDISRNGGRPVRIFYKNKSAPAVGGGE